MLITIQPIDRDTLALAQSIDSSFTVTERAILEAREGQIRIRYAPEPPFIKRYPAEDCAAYVGAPERALYLALADGQPAGRVLLRVNWNGFAYIEDIAVAPSLRGQGVGRRLMDQAVDWGRSQGRPGLMLETSDINTAACRFYARRGFTLCGFDTALYRGSEPPLDETALFWYIFFLKI